MLEVTGTKQVSEYINEELAKVRIIYKKTKNKKSQKTMFILCIAILGLDNILKSKYIKHG